MRGLKNGEEEKDEKEKEEVGTKKTREERIFGTKGFRVPDTRLQILFQFWLATKLIGALPEL